MEKITEHNYILESQVYISEFSSATQLIFIFGAPLFILKP